MFCCQVHTEHGVQAPQLASQPFRLAAYVNNGLHATCKSCAEQALRVQLHLSAVLDVANWSMLFCCLCNQDVLLKGRLKLGLYMWFVLCLEAFEQALTTCCSKIECLHHGSGPYFTYCCIGVLISKCPCNTKLSEVVTCTKTNHVRFFILQASSKYAMYGNA